MTDVAGVGRARRAADRPRGRRGHDGDASTSVCSTGGSSSWPPTSPPTSPAGWRRRASTSSRARGELAGTDSVVVTTDGKEQILRADLVLVATGAAPRTLPGAQPDGERILTWEQVYDLDEVPSHLIVVGSGVTGAEFASAYLSLGIDVTLVSSRDRVLPGEDADAAAVLEDVLTRRGMHVLSQVADGLGRAARRHRHRHADRRPHRRGLALHPGARLGAQHVRARPRGGRRPARRRRLHLRRPGLADHGPRRVRRRRLHRRPHARLGRGHAGPDRHVALPRRQGVPARPHPGLLERLHLTGDRHGRLVAASGRRRRGAGGAGDAAARRQRRAPRCRASATGS